MIISEGVSVFMKAVELHDILTYKFLSNVKYAPDGKHAAFVVA